MKDVLPWLVGLAGAGAVFYFMNKRNNAPLVYSNSLTSPGLPPALRPEPAPNTPSPTLCQTVVTVGGTAAAMYYGVPPQASMPLAAMSSKPICTMAKKAQPVIEKSLKATIYEVPKVGIEGSINAPKAVWNATLGVAKAATQSPKAFANASLKLTTTSVTAPVKAFTNTLKAGDPRKWF